MSTSDYVVDILLIAIVFRQMRTRALTLESTLVPLVLVAIAGSNYLKAFPTAGNDLLLTVFFVLVGIALGVTSGVATRVWRNDSGTIVARAGILAAALWIIGMGFRFGFSIYANTTSGAASVGRFSLHHDITSAQAWTTALVLMAFGEVLSRVGWLQLRRIRAERTPRTTALTT